tara:strand:+ start:527 stop:2317 length:1791 start_codon:yes stop_codon:yes gene_type:complete
MTSTASTSFGKRISPEALSNALLEINRWHPNVPLLLAFSRQGAGRDGVYDGGAQAVRETYDDLFGLARIGLSDDAHRYYLHLCHGRQEELPHAIRKPTANYGKTHQRIIKDTFGQQFLSRVSEGRYKLESEFAKQVKSYLKIDAPIDLKPLVIYAHWDRLTSETTVGELWAAFAKANGLAEPPFDQIFTCSGLNDGLDLVDAADFPSRRAQQIVLPREFGGDAFDTQFWTRFRAALSTRLKKLKWQGSTAEIVAEISSGLMHDQSVFLLGAPGTGKTTIVLRAVLPALREAYGVARDMRFVSFTLTPSTSIADLFGFQGLDGEWVEGPMATELLEACVDEELSDGQGQSSDGDSGKDEAGSMLSVPRLLFLDEANRVDIENLLSPLQAAFDRMQQREEPPAINLGRSHYRVPNRIWRIFAGNSPVSDAGRSEQSRPFKRRLSMVMPPDPMEVALESDRSFRSLCLELLGKAASNDDVEVAQPALALLGGYSENSDRLDDLRSVLSQVRQVRRVAMTVGLTESILLRAAAFHSLGHDSALDSALCVSLLPLLAGDREGVENVASTATHHRFAQFGKRVLEDVLGAQSMLGLEVDPLL